MTQSIQILDDNRKVLGLPPQSIQTISSGAAITSYKAIKPTADVVAYFTNNTAGTATISAGDIVLVHEDLRLQADSTCWVF